MNRANSYKLLSAFQQDCKLKQHLAEIDTARMYSHGATERLLGKLFLGNEELAFSIATKANPFPGYDKSLSPASVDRQMTESLKAMGKEQVDIFYLHAPDSKVCLAIC